MSRSVFIGIAAILSAASLASAATIGFSQANYDVNPGGNVVVTVTASGNEGLIVGTDVFVQLGDGGSDLGGSATAPPFPQFTSLTIAAAGNIFTNTDSPGPPTITPLAVIGGASSAGSKTLSAAAAPLAQVGVSAAGAAPGVYLLVLINPDAGFKTDLINTAGGEVPAVLGTATITVLPEPATALLLLGALPFMRRRRSA
jgi:MYXO-CTERM domain-containing protein